MHFVVVSVLAAIHPFATAQQARPCDPSLVVSHAHPAFAAINRASQAKTIAARQALLDEGQALLRGDRTTWTALAESRLELARSRNDVIPRVPASVVTLLREAVAL